MKSALKPPAVKSQGWLLLLVVLFSGPLWAQWYSRIGVEWQRGQYGLQRPATIWSFSGGLRYQFARGQLGLQWPLLVQNSGDVQQAGMVRTPMPGRGRGHPMGNGRQHGTGFRTGLGDMYLSGRYRIFSHQRLTFSLRVGTKLPTASRNRNLGTGEWDWSLGGILTGQKGPQWLEVSAGRWHLGDPPGQPLNDPWFFGAQIGRLLMATGTAIAVGWQAVGSIIAGNEGPIWATFSLAQRLKTGPTVMLVLARGFNQATADWSFSSAVEWPL